MQESSTIKKWIKNRKSTFLNGLKEGGRIEDNIIEELLENATWAPTHGLAQCWEFKVFADGGVDAFFREQQEIYKESTPSEKFNEIKYQKYLEKSKKISHVIAVIARRDPKKRFPKQEDIVSVACAVQNIYLSVQGYGIGGYLSTGNICYNELTREFLGLNEDDECIGFFVLGIPDENFKRPERRRINAAEKTQWIRE